MKITNKSKFWAQHIKAQSVSRQTQHAYCDDHELNHFPLATTLLAQALLEAQVIRQERSEKSKIQKIKFRAVHTHPAIGSRKTRKE